MNLYQVIYSRKQPEGHGRRRIYLVRAGTDSEAAGKVSDLHPGDNVGDRFRVDLISEDVIQLQTPLLPV